MGDELSGVLIELHAVQHCLFGVVALEGARLVGRSQGPRRECQSSKVLISQSSVAQCHIHAPPAFVDDCEFSRFPPKQLVHSGEKSAAEATSAGENDPGLLR